jgi:hypothetical protein
MAERIIHPFQSWDWFDDKRDQLLYELMWTGLLSVSDRALAKLKTEKQIEHTVSNLIRDFLKEQR